MEHGSDPDAADDRVVKRDQDVEDIAVGHSKAAERNPLLVRHFDGKGTQRKGMFVFVMIL